MSGSILFLPPYTQGLKKNIWSELESNPGPLASQATALTTRSCLSLDESQKAEFEFEKSKFFKVQKKFPLKHINQLRLLENIDVIIFESILGLFQRKTSKEMHS